MTDRYERMTPGMLLREMDAWQKIVDAPKGPGGPSNGAREQAKKQMYLAEAWYHMRTQDG